MATSVTPILPSKQQLKLISRGPSFLRNGFTMKGNSAKRKSAVELLQESKAFYVKSEKVLDTKQEFKHSEHLQVSANPNIDLLLKVPALKVASNESNHKTPPVPPPRRSAEFGSSSKPPPIEPKPLVRQIAAPVTVENGHHTRPIVQPLLLPPKSPRLPRPRSKTSSSSSSQQAESQPGSKHAEYRRSHSEREVPEDIQMKLRRLLNTDSKENLHSPGPGDGIVKVSRSGSKSAPESPKKPERPFIVPHNTKGGESAVLQPRHQQEVNYSIHKSMPDLSPTKLGLGGRVARRPHRSSRGSSPDSTSDVEDDGSLFVAAPKSIEMGGHSRATSDYVSRSPSCKAEYLARPPVSPPPPTPPPRTDSNTEKPAAPVKPATNPTTTTTEDGITPATTINPTRRRPILRSKSDISYRYSRSSEFAAEGFGGKLGERNPPRCTADLERFFDSMGLELSVLRVLRSPPSDAGSSPVFFASTSSLDSSHRGRSHSGDSDASPPPPTTAATHRSQSAGGVGLTNKDLAQHGHTETSIVERNARVIKWLYNCRKALTLTTYKMEGGNS